MPIAYGTAVNRLLTETLSIAQLRDLLENVSASVPGATSADTYVLFSGYMPDGTHTSETVDLVRGPHVLTVMSRAVHPG